LDGARYDIISNWENALRIPTLTGADCLNAKTISLSANIGHGHRGRY
jgi:hypothetical protein